MYWYASGWSCEPRSEVTRGCVACSGLGNVPLDGSCIDYRYGRVVYMLESQVKRRSRKVNLKPKIPRYANKSSANNACSRHSRLYLHLGTGKSFLMGGDPIGLFCLSAYSLTKIEHLISSHSFFLLCNGNLLANSNPLALSIASMGTSKSVNGLSLWIGAFGSTKAPKLTFPPVLPSSAKMTL